MTVDKIIILMEEIALFRSRLTDVINDQNVALKVTLGVLENRVEELRARIHD